jgi:hypothetical protein
VQVHYDEDIANHIGPKPCTGIREGTGEASAGVRVGQSLSHETGLVLCADAVTLAEGEMSAGAIASAQMAWRGLRHWHIRTLLAREPGDLRTGQRGSARVRMGKARSRRP